MRFPITASFVCPMCSTYHTLTVELEQYLNYLDGMLIQEAFPEMSPTDRERFLSSFCPDCQEKIFKEI